ncbi:Hypothetical predicted protein [Pelobates cultripes]|uniref:Uncharacterized protein n=1 Tax=Pelobates cultripes TaxID=61616 RepID=A0AAD1VWZ7_PELCU|nr:Hypothetical predicted protein [Pelobates cultripes]
MADTMCAKAPSYDTADTLTKLYFLFARFWSMLNERIQSSTHHVLASSSNRHLPPSATRKRASAIPARARTKRRKKTYPMTRKHPNMPQAWAQRLYTQDYAQQQEINHSFQYLKA